jgi:type III secretory pathway lipoprotein EscJ
MRSDNSPPSPLARVRAAVVRTLSWAEQRGIGGRWVLALLALAALALAVYFTALDEPGESGWLYGGHAFSHEDIAKITQALAANQIDAMADERGRVAVSLAKMARAHEILAKQDLALKSPGDRLDKALAMPNIWEGPEERRQRLNRVKEECFEDQIKEMDGIESASVLISRERSRRLNSAWDIKALVVLGVAAGRRVPSRTILAIQHMLAGAEIGLKPEAVTIIDKAGNRIYLTAENANLSFEAQIQAREEDLAAELLAQLNWIEGVRVSVKLDRLAAPPGAEAPPTDPPAAVVAPNAPLDLESESAPAPQPQPAEPKPGVLGKARILIQVPISHYQRAFHLAGPHREPSTEDLRPYDEKTRQAIENAVKHVIPAGELAKLDIIKIPAPRPMPSVIAPMATEPSRHIPWWAFVAAASALVVFVFVAGRMLAWQGSSGQTLRGPHRARADRDEPSGPSSSERVRELVRRNPEAAAGVLQRWIGQGGHAG